MTKLKYKYNINQHIDMNTLRESNPAFFKATPEEKSKMIMEGYKKIALQVLLIGMDLDALNIWLRSEPCFKDEESDIKKLTDCLQHYALSTDMFTELHTINSSLITQLLEALTKEK